MQTDLRGANLSGVDLREANLTGAENLSQEQLDSTYFGDEHTRLPSGLKTPAKWNVKTDEQIEGE